MSSHRGIRRRIAVVATLLTVFLVYHFTFGTVPDTTTTSSHNAHGSSNQKTQCPPLPGIEDVLVIMKTGVTEALDKVPVHFQTTLRCIPNYVIFSDFEEEINGVKIHDALRGVDPVVKDTVADFQIYNRLQEHGRKGLESQDFADEANSAIGKPNNPGWKLDKWKFLPMVKESYLRKPDAKWYVFMEADTYYSWPTLLAWLERFDASKPLYIGTETQIADVIFAHGGSGFMISNPAMKRAVDEYDDNFAELHEYTDTHWAGDCVLGKVLSNVGVDLTFSWPILQNTNIGELDEFTTGFYRRPWCFPAVAFHHLSPSDVKFLHDFEQRRLAKVNYTRYPPAFFLCVIHWLIILFYLCRVQNLFCIATFSRSLSFPSSPTSEMAGITLVTRNNRQHLHSRNASPTARNPPTVSNSSCAVGNVIPVRRHDLGRAPRMLGLGGSLIKYRRW